MECVTVFERRSHLGPPDEGRLGPSDDDDDDDDNDNDDDLYIIGAVCLCVKKVIISVFKRFVSHVYRHFQYSRYLVISPVKYRLRGTFYCPKNGKKVPIKGTRLFTGVRLFIFK